MKKAVEANHVIVGIHVKNRVRNAAGVQEVLTKFGKNIKTRIGLHDIHANGTASNGLIIIELIGSDRELDRFAETIENIKGVEVQAMVFEHD
jgi:hypothetical protein